MSIHSVPNGDENGENGDDPQDAMIEELENWAEEMAGLSDRIRAAAAQMRRGEEPHE